ncbi:MAG: reprolysin-like metallopeptidase [Motiliproteus sp.]
MRSITKSLAISALILSFTLPTSVYAAAKAPLFSHDTASVGELPPKAKKKRVRSVKINYGQLRSAKLQLNLFDDLTIEAVRSRHVDYKDKGEVWIGKVSNKADSQITLARVGDSIHGTIQIGDDLYKILPGKGKSHVIVQVDGAPPYPELDPNAGIPMADTLSDTAISSIATADITNGSVIDVMVVYTPAANAATSNIESLILLAVEETNQAYISSGINAQLNLVHTAAVNYVESSSMQTDLSNLTNGNDGYMDAIHSYRDTYGADMVSLLVNRSDYCGMAWLMGSPTSNFSANAFSVVNYSCATGYYSFGHELGHNMGVTHARQDTSGGGAFPYAFGFKDDATRTFRSVMAYNCTSGCTRRQFFSNPLNDYNGMATGIDHDLDPYNSADNARALNGTVANVMSWRAPVPTSPPATPAGLSATVLSSNEIALSWSDTSSDETGFTLERSDGGTGWQVAATTASNNNGFTDSPLSPSSSYSYRLNAYNGAGTSAYTTTVSATTEAAPSAFEQHVASEQSDKGTVSGNYSALRLADNYTQRLTEASSGGKPRNRTGVLQHIWQFNLQSGNAHTLKLVGSASTSSSNDNYQILFSTNAVNYTHAFVINAGDSGEYQALLPAGYMGPLYIMARDTDATAGNKSYDTLTVDQLVVLTENVLGDPPYPPGSLAVMGSSSNSVQLSWINDDRTSRSGTYVFRNGNLVDTLNASSSSYTNSGLASSSSYQYSLKAFNSSGSSLDSNAVSATTQPSTGATLSVRGYKSKGSHKIDISWSPSGDMDIYRDGNIIANINGSSYTDSPGTKGGATFSYKVCNKGTSQCSSTKNVVF